MENTPVHLPLHGITESKSKLENVEIINIAPLNFENKTQQSLNKGNEAINNERLDIQDDDLVDVSLNKTSQTPILHFQKEETNVSVVNGEHTTPPAKPDILRLFVKNGEFVYAHSRDIVVIESCDHLVKVHLMSGDKVKKAIRHDTLKEFLSHLPANQFMRIGRFCAINLNRLSGGNFNNQTFEFDFKISIKLQHSISNSAFKSIGK